MPCAPAIAPWCAAWSESREAQRGSQEAVKHRGAVAAACAARGQGPAQGGWHHAGGQAYAGAEGGREAYIHSMEEGMRARGRQCREASWAGHGSGGVVGRRSRLLTARWPRRRPSRCQAGRRSTAGSVGGGWVGCVGWESARPGGAAGVGPASEPVPTPTHHAQPPGAHRDHVAAEGAAHARGAFPHDLPGGGWGERWVGEGERGWSAG